MTKQLTLYTSSSELKELFAETIKQELSTFFGKENTSDTRLRTRKEVAKLLGISLPTLHLWTKEGVIQAFRIGNTIRYKMEDIELALHNIESIKYMRGRTINNSQQ